ncbi:MAG: Spy/CpxP family protein refolding chaperone [Proteobacteria bacterium]|nr:Spy/CpxP family protein refolding chaperone [Pseudomonadota bacterium]
MRTWLSGFCLGLGLLASPVAMAQAAPPRLGQLHDALHLTPEQEDAWRDYMAAIASNRQGEARHRAAQAMMPKLSTPRRIALMDATLEQDLADLRREGQAVVAFYGHLTAAQQAVFDRQTLRVDREGAGD